MSTGYNPFVLVLGHAHLVALVVLVVAFVAFHPYLDEAGLWGLGECPEASQTSHAPHAGVSTACLFAELVTSGARSLAFSSFLGRRRADGHPGPTEAYLSPDPPRPRVSPSR